METLRIELKREGAEAHFVAVNVTSGIDYQDDLAAKCRFPLFQDLPELDLWGSHQGGKDDFFIYDASGALVAFLPASGEVETNLSTAPGYANLKAAILTAMGLTPPAR